MLQIKYIILVFILPVVFSLWIEKNDTNCTCHPHAEKGHHYCGHQINNPNCIKQRRYACLEGPNKKAASRVLCATGPCYVITTGPDAGLKACKTENEYSEDLKNGFPRCEECYFPSPEDADNLAGETFVQRVHYKENHRFKLFQRNPKTKKFSYDQYQ